MPMSENRVRELAHTFFKTVVNKFGADYLIANGIRFDEIYDAIIYPQYEIAMDIACDLGLDDDGIQILGQFLPKENVARISRVLVEGNDPRKVFTCWHEVVGHGVLQGRYLRKNLRKHPKLFTTQESIRLWENTFERQANLFASNVAAPQSYIRVIGTRVFGTDRRIRFIGPGHYFIGNRRVYATTPQNLAWLTAKVIQPYFGGLSAEALSYQVSPVFIDPNGFDWGKPFDIGSDVRTIGQLVEATLSAYR